MNTKNATLMAHSGASKVTREKLRDIPVPKATRTHQPISHFEIVERLEEALSYRYLKIERDEYAVSSNGMKMFGVMDLNYEFSGCRFSIGLRNSNDKSMRLALTAGYRVFVCDNMAFSGDFDPLSHKHTKNLELSDAISIAVDRIHRTFDPISDQVGRMREMTLPDEAVKLLIYRAFMDKRIKGMPKHLMSVVHKYYFKPEHEAFTPRTLWSLSNAFTSAFKKLTPLKQFEVTARLGNFLSEAEEELNGELPLRLGEIDSGNQTGKVIQMPNAFAGGESSANAADEDSKNIKDIPPQAEDFGYQDFDEDDFDDSFYDEEFEEYFDREVEDEFIDEMIEKQKRKAA